MNISQIIRNTRTTQGISQSQMAARLGYTKSTISRLENGLIEWKFEDVAKALELLGLKIILKGE